MIRLICICTLLTTTWCSSSLAEIVNFVPAQDIEYEDPTGDGMVFNSSSPDLTLLVRGFLGSTFTTENKAILQYDLTSLAGKVIDEASLAIDVRSFTSATENVLVGGFMDAPGSISPFTDFNSPLTQLALFTPSDLGATTIDLSPSFIDSVVQGSGILGIRLESTGSSNFSFVSSDGATLFSTFAPTLNLSAVPEPSAGLACTFVLASGALRRRQRQR